MNVVTWKDFMTGGFPALEERETAAISIGVFDGVHIGHQKLIQHIVENPSGSRPIIVTFVNNPSEILHPHKYLGNLSTLEQKIRLFETRGVHNVILIDFSSEFSKLSGKQFFEVLNEKLNIRFVSIGRNFHCGRNSDTNAFGVKNIMDEEGAQVEIVEQVRYKEDTVSSTRIRNAVLQGKMLDVRDMLGRPYSIDLSRSKISVLNGKTNLNGAVKQLMPKYGRYKVTVHTEDTRKTDELLVDNTVFQLNDSYQKIKEIHFI